MRSLLSLFIIVGLYRRTGLVSDCRKQKREEDAAERERKNRELMEKYMTSRGRYAQLTKAALDKVGARKKTGSDDGKKAAVSTLKEVVTWDALAQVRPKALFLALKNDSLPQEMKNKVGRHEEAYTTARASFVSSSNDAR